jgi:hypothetical protein
MQQEFSCSDSEAVYMRQGTVPKHNNVYASAPVPDSSVVDPEWFSPDPDFAFQVIPDPDRNLKLGQVSNWQILVYGTYIMGLQCNLLSILKFFKVIVQRRIGLL